MGALRCGSLFARLCAVAFASAAGSASANVASRRAQQLPVGLCGEILDQTYGALQGWTPSERQLRAMCKGLLVHSLKVVRTAATAAGPCHSFAQKVSVEASARQRSGSRLPPLPQLKESLCGVRPRMPPTSLPNVWQAAPREEQSMASIREELQSRSTDMMQAPPRSTALTAVATETGHGSHHHHRHKVLRPAPVDAATMLKLREDLLAGRDDVNPLLDPTKITSGGASAKSLQTLQVVSAVSKAEQEPDNVASTTEPLPVVANSAEEGASPSVLASLSDLVSSGVSWLRDRTGSTVDFICDGGCRELGVQPRRAEHLIVN